jgi:hypothetical protein
MTTTINPRVARLNAAKAEKAAVIAWETAGKGRGPRPETPAMDEITAEFNAPKTSARKARSSEPRQPSAIDQQVRDLFIGGTISHPATKGEVAAALEVPRSTAGHALRRLTASGECEMTEKPLRFWLLAAGKANPVPVRETAERTPRVRKEYTVITKSGTTHTAHRTKALGLVPVCVNPETGKIPAAVLADEQNVAPSCKRCVKALAAVAS